MPHQGSMDSMFMSKASSSDISQEGYDYEFVSSTERFECPICLLCIRDPHLTECGHRFCNNCIRRWLRDEDRGKKCPSCNDLLSELQIYPDNFTKREILSLLVKCPFEDQGCPITMELKKVEAHKAGCDYEQVPCPQGCSARMPKKDVGAHLRDDCSRRLVPCPHCSLNMAVDKLEGHMGECELASTCCEYCQLVLIRQQINRHWQTDCPKALVKCLFHRFGCEELLPRTDIQQHNVQQTQLHLRLLALTMDGIIRANPDLQPVSGHDSDTLSSWLVGETAVPEGGGGGGGDSAAAVGYSSTPKPLHLLIPPPEQRLAPIQPMITPGASKADDSPSALAMRRRFQAQALATSCSLHDDDGGDDDVPQPSGVQLSQRRSSALPPPHASATAALAGMSFAGSFDEKSGYAKGGEGSSGLGLSNGGSDSDLKKEKYVGGGECGGALSAADVSLQSASEAHRIRELEKESAMQRQYVFEMKAKLSASERQLQATQAQLADLEGRLCGGTYVWKLHGYAKLRQQGASGGGGSAAANSGVLHSPGFYTSFYGYKFCMRVNVNGVDSGQGTHLSLFVHLMQSDNDDLLTWPFQGKITLTVLDQGETPGARNHITETLQAKPSLTAFQRPTAPRNHKGFGYLEFAPFSYLENAPFVKNDMLLIRAEVKPA